MASDLNLAGKYLWGPSHVRIGGNSLGMSNASCHVMFIFLVTFIVTFVYNDVSTISGPPNIMSVP